MVRSGVLEGWRSRVGSGDQSGCQLSRVTVVVLASPGGQVARALCWPGVAGSAVPRALSRWCMAPRRLFSRASCESPRD